MILVNNNDNLKKIYKTIALIIIKHQDLNDVKNGKFSNIDEVPK